MCVFLCKVWVCMPVGLCPCCVSGCGCVRETHPMGACGKLRKKDKELGGQGGLWGMGKMGPTGEGVCGGCFPDQSGEL